jgi:hypothetical protein
MDQHPPHVNYGNAMNGRIPHYRGKRLYKIDWKVCFMRWSLMQANGDPEKTPYYHVFVEDDSYMCTEHVIYQMDILRQMSQSQKIRPFRTGYPMADGFGQSIDLLFSLCMTDERQGLPWLMITILILLLSAQMIAAQ